eukprot:785122-Prorocentrum_minimum.AAC.2
MAGGWVWACSGLKSSAMMGGTLPLVPGNVVAVTKAVAKAISKGDAIPVSLHSSPPIIINMFC